jgi:predicted pyridoxine 5'-phosphate oxidase superfamily flavin-nucleotide-binding protein
MISEPIRQLLENLPYIFVATSDQSGQPHVAIGEQVVISGDCQLVFENWFCPATLQNIANNTHVSVVAVVPDTGKGYQLIGSVNMSANTALLNGYEPDVEKPGIPQVLTRFTVRIEKILEFTIGIHSDLPIS